MSWRRWPDWRQAVRAVREAFAGLRGGGSETEDKAEVSAERDMRMESDRQSKSAQALIRDIREAHRDWVNAHRHFEYAAGFDQIDYAIYAIEAAEKRYEMLLRQAKKLNVHWRSEWEKGAGAG
jgi:hypothetical protein